MSKVGRIACSYTRMAAGITSGTAPINWITACAGFPALLIRIAWALCCDQDCLGIVLPSTARADGYTIEKSRGNVKTMPAHGRFHCEYVAGAVSQAEVEQIETKVSGLLKAHG